MPGPGGYAYGYRWGDGDGRVIEEIRQVAELLQFSPDRVICRVLEALDRKPAPDLFGRTAHELYRYRVLTRGDEVLSVHLAS
jgi:beta-phosphoglucomutase-like phosphatase (HAD superfamily)